MKQVTGLLLIVGLILLAAGGCHSWEYDTTVDGVPYERIRYEEKRDGRAARSIGYIDGQTEIDELVYTGWLHRRDDGSVLGGLLAEDATVAGIVIPAQTWVSFDEEGRLASCHFPTPQKIQGVDCDGTGGGSKGAVVTFYPDGTLKQFFAPDDVEIQGIPCRGGLFNSVQLHESGALKQCTLAERTTIDGIVLDPGVRVSLDTEGRLTSS